MQAPVTLWGVSDHRCSAFLDDTTCLWAFLRTFDLDTDHLTTLPFARLNADSSLDTRVGMSEFAGDLV